MFSLELQRDLIYEIHLSGSKEEKKQEIERYRKSDFFSYLNKKRETTTRDLKWAIIFIGLAAAFIMTVIIETITVYSQGNSWLMGIGFSKRSLIFYFYLVAMSSFFGNGIVLVFGAIRALKPIPMTEAEMYIHELFNDMSESGELIENYVEFQEIDEDTVGYRLKNAKIDWDFEKLIACFRDLDSIKGSLTLIFCIWLITGGLFTIIMTQLIRVTTISLLIVFLIGILTVFISLIVFHTLLKDVNAYRSLRKEFINAQILQINRLYAEANRNPNDEVHQLKVANAHELLKRLEQTPWHPFKPLVTLVALIPFIPGLISFLPS